MKTLITGLLVLSLLSATFACGKETTPKWTDTSLLPLASQDELDVTGVSIYLNNFITFRGTAEFPDGTVLLSQLFEDDKALLWWPIDQQIKVDGGRWEIKVLIGDNRLSSPYYRLIVYNPSVKTTFSFNLKGPPPAY